MSINNYQLSVIIPTLGRSCLLQTLQSLLKSNGFNELEIIILGKLKDKNVKEQVQNLIKEYSNISLFEIQYSVNDVCLKRNFGCQVSHSDIIAFLDDDVEISSDWLKQITKPFQDDKVGLVSGPGLLPNNLSTSSRLAGLALSSQAAGIASHRYLKAGNDCRDAKWDEVIGCNHAYRKTTFENIGGYSTEIYPGDDLFSAWKTNNAGWKIKYNPNAWVLHYPRQSLFQFCKQIFTYGSARIKLMKKKVYGTQSPLAPLAPFLWVNFLIFFIILGFFYKPAWIFLGICFGIYALINMLITFSITKQTKNLGDLRLWFILFLMHISYGFGETVGLIKSLFSNLLCKYTLL